MRNKFRFSSPSKRLQYGLSKKKKETIIRKCGHCGVPRENCLCTRTQHIFNPESRACVKCGHTFSTNGTGPADRPWLRFVIRLSWFNRWCDSVSDRHDEDYEAGYTRFHKNQADQKMYNDTKAKIDRTWYLRPKSIWYERAEINYDAVQKDGDSSFNWDGCINESDNLN